MTLRSGRVLGSAPPPPPPPPPSPPLPPGRRGRSPPSPPRDPAIGFPPVQHPPALVLPVPPPPNSLLGLPRPLRMAILDNLFQGQERVQVERHVRPSALARLCRVNRMLKDEATEAYLRATPFQVTILSAFPDFDFYHTWVNRGQGPPPAAPPGKYLYTMNNFRQRVADAQLLIPSLRSYTFGNQGRIRMSVSPRVEYCHISRPLCS